jgi:hypothetical protein
MAEGREYRIVIEYGSLPDESEVGGSPISQSPSGGSNQNKDGGNVAGKTIASTIGLAQPFINTALTMRSNEIATVTGSAQLARRQNLINSAVQGSVSALQKGLVGGSVAAALGASTGVGAVVGIGLAAVQKVLDIAVKAEQIANNIEVESTAINVTKARAGMSYNRSRSK